jgi:hypothetical protein
MPAKQSLDEGLEDRVTDPSKTPLTFASHLIVPVPKRPGVVARSPDVQLEKIGQVKTVRRGDKLEVLAVECRQSIVVVLQPRSWIHDVLDAQQLALTLRTRNLERLRQNPFILNCLSVS